MAESTAKMYSPNIPDSGKPRIVIAGGGFGGIHLLKKLKSSKFQIVLIDRYNYHTFQPLLYQVATAGLEPDSIAGPLRKIIERNNNIYFRMLKVDRVDPENHEIETNAGTLKFDYLVIATGAKMNYFNNESIAKNAFPLKQITHALDLRSQIFQQFEKIEILSDDEVKNSYMTFVVVGAGPTGVEVCGALAELKRRVLPKDYPELDIDNMQIYLIEGVDRILPAMSAKSGAKALKYLERMGVKVMLNCRTETYKDNVVKLDNGLKIKAHTVIWAAGVQGNLIDGFHDESIEKGKILVDDINRVYKDYSLKETYENIFAIGDIASQKMENYPHGLPGLAQVAIQQGKHLARNLNAMLKKKKPKTFSYRNKGVLATIGRNKAVADFPGNIRISGFIGWLIWMIVHLLFLVGFRNKAVVLANWTWNYFTYDRGIRLILRPSTKEKDQISRELLENMKE